MLLIKDIIYHQKLHCLSIVTTTLATTLVLIVTILSGSVFNAFDGQIEKMGISISMLEIVDTERVNAPMNEFKQQLNLLAYYQKEYGEYLLVSCDPIDQMFHFQFQQGHFFEAIDCINQNNVAVIGSKVASYLSVGQVLEIDGLEFTIVGILKENSQSMYGSYDDCIFIPCNNGISYDSLQLYSYDSLDRLLLDQYCGKENYVLIDQSFSLKAYQSLEKVLEKALYGLSYFSFLIASVSLVNQCINKLKQRYQEIGIKKSIGATNQDIFSQFLLETLLVQWISILLSILILWIFVWGFQIETIPYGKCFGQLVVMMTISLLTGLYPSKKAARLTIRQCVR